MNLSTGARLTRVVAIGVALLFLILTTAGWIASIGAGHEGILNADERVASDVIVITEISPGSPVAQAGLRPGDRVLAINGRGMGEDQGEVAHQQLHERRAGKPMLLTVQRTSRSPSAPIEEIRVVAVSQLAIPSNLLNLIIATVVGLLILGVATGVALARPADPTARVFFVFGAGFAYAATGNVMHWAMPSRQLGDLDDRIGVIAVILSFAALFHLFLAFPTPKPALLWLCSLGPAPLRRVGGATFLIYALAVVVPAGLLLGVIDDFGLLFPVLFLALLGTLVSLVLSYRQAKGPVARSQLKWVTWGLAVFVGAQLLGTALPGASLFRVYAIPPAPFTAAFAVFPLSIGVAVFRHHLWDVDVLIHRTLVYGALSLLLVGVYLGGIVLLQPVFQTLTGERSDLATVGSTLAMGVLFQPMRRRVQTLIDRWFYRRKYDAAKVLLDFSATVRDEVDLGRLTSELLCVVDETMQPSHVSLWLHVPDGPGQRRLPAHVDAAVYGKVRP